ncbi:hypothetical protein CH275_16555 [Rhodococcus sp. 06-235-1A]|uniref:SET domain-containing protein-lysine N-methyltransferase n=1 Tax=Rhodococcus sp. 06-235-1A TaxID=2022508 RepID=UPI000B9AF724|nr:hypothetical protein CH275_16555 [Rhodococcus sp. 06-235-1A]
MLDGRFEWACSEIGTFGVRAAELVPLGSIVWFPCPKCPRWTVSERQDLSTGVDSRLDSWGYPLFDGSLLVPCSGAQMINHSCDPTVLNVGLDFGIAVRDIEAGQEVTVDYSAFDTNETRSMHCSCRASACRIEISTLDATNPAMLRKWSEQLKPAVDAMRKVDQPLGSYLSRWSQCFRDLRAGSSLSELSCGDSVVRPGFCS